MIKRSLTRCLSVCLSVCLSAIMISSSVTLLNSEAAKIIEDLPYVAAIGMIQSAIVLPLMFGVKKILSKLGPKTEG